MATAHSWGPRFPKSVLHEFYQQHSSSGNPTFSTESGPRPPSLPSFTCTLTIPAIHTPMGSFEEKRFMAWSRSKKSAEHAAAEKALSYLVAEGLLQPSVNRKIVGAMAPDFGMLDTFIQQASVAQERPRAPSSTARLQHKRPAAAAPCHPDASEDEPAEVGLNNFSREELLSELRKARQANAQLKAELLLEQQRRAAVLTILVQID